jgi:hypothetical protein
MPPWATTFVKVNGGANVPDLATAGLVDEEWRIVK